MRIDGISSIDGNEAVDDLEVKNDLVVVLDAVVDNGVFRYYPQKTINVVELYVSLNQAPSGSDLIIEMTKNDIVVATAIVTDGQTDTEVSTDIEFLTTDVMNFNITQVGSSASGDGLNIQITYS